MGEDYKKSEFTRWQYKFRNLWNNCADIAKSVRCKVLALMIKFSYEEEIVKNS